MEVLTFPAVLENLPRFVESVRAGAESFGLNRKKVQRLELALEEALVNVASYAYPQGTGSVEVRFECRNESDFVVEIIDQGAPFDILARTDPDTTQDIDERKIGGLGILLIKEVLDHVDYRREAGKNILTFTLAKEGM